MELIHQEIKKIIFNNNTLPKIIDYIKPDFVHVFQNGKIVKTGCSELAEELEKTFRYEKFRKMKENFQINSDSIDKILEIISKRN